MDKRAEAAKPSAQFRARREAAKRAPEEKAPAPARWTRGKSPRRCRDGCAAATGRTPRPARETATAADRSGIIDERRSKASRRRAAFRSRRDSHYRTSGRQRRWCERPTSASPERGRARLKRLPGPALPLAREWRRRRAIHGRRGNVGGSVGYARCPDPGDRSPGPTTAWFVGRAGAVFVFSESNWARVTFPESIDLTAVRAMSAREAAGDNRGWPHVPNQRRRPDVVAARKSTSSVLRTGSGKPAQQGACQNACTTFVGRGCRGHCRIVIRLFQTACRRGGRTDNHTSRPDDHRRPDGPVADRLQLRSGPRSRHAKRHAALRKLRPALHGHRGDGESGDDSFSIPHQSRGRERARTELRVPISSSPRSCCGNTSAAMSRWSAPCRRTAAASRKKSARIS